MRFKALTAASMKFRFVFWDVLPCKIMRSSPWWWRQHVSLKRQSTIILHGSTSQKTNLNFLAMFVEWILYDEIPMFRSYLPVLQNYVNCNNYIPRLNVVELPCYSFRTVPSLCKPPEIDRNCRESIIPPADKIQQELIVSAPSYLISVCNVDN
jgi:hypothetical protein